MIFYEVELLSMPRIIFAYGVEFDKYKNSFVNKEDFLELAVCEQGRVLFEHCGGTKEIAYPGMLMPILCDMCCETSSYLGEKQNHITVGVNVKYKFRKYTYESQCNIKELKRRMKDKNNCIILIPYHFYIDEIYSELIFILRRIAGLYCSENPADGIRAVAEWYAAAGLITDFVMKKLEGDRTKLPPSELVYAEKAARYIHMNYSEKLSVGHIADHLGISEGYLHRLFKNSFGIGVSEYINRHRISVAIELAENKNASLKEAALNVGIEDAAYMSRLFKKVTGMGFREYFAQKRVGKSK